MSERRFEHLRPVGHDELPSVRWRASAVWRADARPGLYRTEGGPAVDFGEVVVFDELDHAKRWRAAMRQRHPGAVVDIHPLSAAAGSTASRGPVAPRGAAGAALALARAALLREVSL